MENFFVCLNAVLPIFLTICVGYLAQCFGLITREDVTRMNRLTFRIFIPVMVFYNIYSSELSSAVNPVLIAFSFISILVIFFAAKFIVYRSESVVNRRGVLIQALFRSNFVIIGIPIAKSLLGDVDMGTVAVLLACDVPLFNVLAVWILTVNNGEKPDTGRVLKNIASNPIILGTLAGVALVLLKIRLPAPILAVVEDISDMVGPFTLFLLGAFFEFKGLGRCIKELSWACIGRLLLVPALVLPLGYALGFRGIEFVALMGLFASPTAVNSFTMAEQMGGDAPLAGSIVVMTSALCSFSMFLWCFIFKSLGAF